MVSEDSSVQNESEEITDSQLRMEQPEEPSSDTEGSLSLQSDEPLLKTIPGGQAGDHPDAGGDNCGGMITTDYQVEKKSAGRAEKLSRK